jgi:hypothetical protein
VENVADELDNGVVGEERAAAQVVGVDLSGNCGLSFGLPSWKPLEFSTCRRTQRPRVFRFKSRYPST